MCEKEGGEKESVCVCVCVYKREREREKKKRSVNKLALKVTDIYNFQVDSSIVIQLKSLQL